MTRVLREEGKMKLTCVVMVALGAAVAAGPAGAQSGNLAVNPGFESALSAGWNDVWTREPDAAMVSVVGEAHSGSSALQVTHTGTQDWCISQSSPIAVAAGDIFELSGWIACTDLEGEANFSVVTYDAGDAVMDWIYGSAATSGTHDWEQVLARFVVPQGCAKVNLRIVGRGSGVMRFDDISLVKEGSVMDSRGPAEDIEFGNDAVGVVFHTETATFTVTDRRSEIVYDQLALSALPVVKEAEAAPDGASMTATLWDPATDLELQVRLAVPATPMGAAEVRCELSAAGAMPRNIVYPAPFAPRAGAFLVIPMNEGILFPVADEGVSPVWLVGYSGHGISMGWFGQCQGEEGPGVMGIIEDPNDMHIRVDRPRVGENEMLCVWPEWEPARGEFAYSRTVNFIFLTSGGYVSQAKRYREYAKESGLYKSLREKLEENPNVDLLIGAVNVWAPSWYGNDDPVGLVDEMQSLGIERLIYSEGSSPEVVAALNEREGVLTSRYDIYQDVWPPDAPEGAKHEGWPEDLIWDAKGDIVQGWVIRDGETLYPGGVICSPRGLEHAQARIPAELARTPYRCRFIDTTTASPWRECYNPDHPTSRTEDRKYKMELLRLCSDEAGLVTGTETGIDASVPYVHYYEGMLSLGPYRLPDCGYTMIEYKEPTPEFLKYQVGPYYRVPLWELVYHDCTVAQWYWGDSTNKAPEVWDQRDLFNLLYGTPPLFMLSPEVWEEHKERFAQSYQAVCPTARRVGYDEMVSHEFLTEDHTLQRTAWSSGISVVVNFANRSQSLPDGGIVPAMGSLVLGGCTE